MSDPIGPDQGTHGNIPLGQSPGILIGRGKPLKAFQRNVILEDVQQSGDIFPDTRQKDFLDDTVPADLRNFIKQVFPYVTAHLREV
ncbi:hypothetical protein GCM10022207_71900 [Streptomyces lannensis]|uniref:Uncharacterized protein n=1 Tax=Streptomyces lannensis TaxID=766498 RepID=A0ABP7L3T7_9ACTN